MRLLLPTDQNGSPSGRDPYELGKRISGRRPQVKPVMVTLEEGATIDAETLNNATGLTINSIQLGETDMTLMLSGDKKLTVSLCGKRGLVVHVKDIPKPVQKVHPGAQRHTARTPNAALLTEIKD